MKDDQKCNAYIQERYKSKWQYKEIVRKEQQSTCSYPKKPTVLS